MVAPLLDRGLIALGCVLPTRKAGSIPNQPMRAEHISVRSGFNMRGSDYNSSLTPVEMHSW